VLLMLLVLQAMGNLPLVGVTCGSVSHQQSRGRRPGRPDLCHVRRRCSSFRHQHHQQCFGCLGLEALVQQQGGQQWVALKLMLVMAVLLGSVPASCRRRSP